MCHWISALLSVNYSDSVSYSHPRPVGRLVGYDPAFVATETIDLHTAAERLGVHYQTAYKWVRSGELPAVQVNGRYRLDPAEVSGLSERRA